MEISCPGCGEAEAIRGERRQDAIFVVCETCACTWDRPLKPTCSRCGGVDMQRVPLAIMEKGRGTQLSVVGTRPIYLCSSCDAETLVEYHANRPNPLLPADIPNAGL